MKKLFNTNHKTVFALRKDQVVIFLGCCFLNGEFKKGLVLAANLNQIKCNIIGINMRNKYEMNKQ